MKRGEANRKILLKQAKSALNKNWSSLGKNQGYTIPAQGLYPFQWNWDSGFIAYGYSHYNLPRAIEELRSLFKGQWSNGMLPHIIFHKNNKIDTKDYSLGPKFWDTKSISKNASKKVDTSAITQPPMQALAVWHIYKALLKKNKKSAISFLKEFYPKLIKLHNYLHTQRDPEESGLITIYHPWESGFDNSPRWDKALRRIKPKKIPEYNRWDLQHVKSRSRPSKEDYDRYVYLALELKKKKYDDKKINKSHPFRIKDKVFSTILYLADIRLHHISSEIQKSTIKIEDWTRRFEKAFYRKLWNNEDKLFYDFDLISKRQIKIRTIGALMPLVTGLLERKEVNKMSKNINTANFCGKKICKINLFQSVESKENYFRHENYWRGPVWLNINWFLWRGLKLYGMNKQAKHLEHHLLDLVSKKGFYEYYSPITGEGLGAKNFSWSASLVIDMLNDKSHE